MNTPRRQHITLSLPPEFIALCQADGVKAQTVLRGFIADLCDLNDPDHDYLSHGSHERALARAYYERVGYPYWKSWGQHEDD